MPAIAPVHNWGARQPPRKRKRAIVKPACVAAALLVNYIVFVYLILMTFEDSTGQDSGAVHHLGNSLAGITSRLAALRKQASSQSAESNASENNHPSSGSENSEHPELFHFCGDCLWKDTLITCDERVAWEVKKGASEVDAKKENLMYCVKPDELHIADYCGSCRWKDTALTCDERVGWEVEHKKLSEIDAKKRNLAYCKRHPYTLSPLCGGCARAMTNMTSKQFRSGVPCNDIMMRRVKQGQAKSLNDAARIVADEFRECEICHPEDCWRSYFNDLHMSVQGLDEDEKGFLTKYWRFDRVAPELTSPITLTLPAIPEKFRIPPSRFHDIEAFYTEKYREFESNDDLKHVPIFIEYNPGLAPIPPAMKKYLPKYAAYAVVLRVTPANNCFRRDQMSELPQKVWDHTMMSATNLLGIALLDEYYALIPGYDVVLDPATQLGFQKDGYGTTYFGEPTFMDYRLFTLNGAIYLHANADVTVVTKLDIRSKEHSRNAEKIDCTKFNFKDHGECKLDVVYGEDNLEVTMLHQFNTIWSGGERGKNFALFAVPNQTHPHEPDSIYAEVDINPYHKVQQVYLDEIEFLGRPSIKNRIRRNYSVDKIMMRKVRDNGNVTESARAPPPSFFTVDEFWFPGSKPSFREAGHGGACCVSLSRREVLAQGEHIHLTPGSWGDNEYLLVGVAHTSVIWRRWHSSPNTPDSAKALVPHTHYVSFFYAFEPRPPFNLRVRSGYFCLGFAGDHGAEGGMFNSHSILTTNRKLSQHNETFSCPQIHFVSSFVEKVGDTSTAVIGYGINDCTPRIVEVSKKEIARMLFSDPWEMKIDKDSSEFDRKESEALTYELPVNW
ncbi:hypothetical protein ACHAXT_013242 [Thalassiosira profunda]